MAKKKKSSDKELAEKDREAIEKAAQALNAFDDEDALIASAIGEDFVEQEDESADMAIWKEDEPEDDLA